MRFQKAERCSAGGCEDVLHVTLPQLADAPAAPSSPAAAFCVAIAAATTSVVVLSGGPDVDVGDLIARAFAYWSSIVLEGLPFVVTGAGLAALMASRIRNVMSAVLVALAFPGCDCGLAGFAPALRRGGAAAGFAMTWGAAANPTALFFTHLALGDRVLFARLAGSLVAAIVTAMLWNVVGSGRRRDHGECDAPPVSARIGGAMASLALAGFAATAAAMSPLAGRIGSSGFTAAVCGALLSPCSTADALIARVMFHDRGAQATFVLAAQCIDVRQLSVLSRNFGAARASLAAIAGCAGCVAAWLAAR